jgi:ATP phosphoribosyltransferase
MEENVFMKEDLVNFNAAEIKIAVQKSGELTQFALGEFRRLLGADIPNFVSMTRKLYTVVGGGRIGIEFANNKDICQSVERGFADLAIVGTDRFAEDIIDESSVVILRSYRTERPWRMVVAVREDSSFRSLRDLRTIATQYPNMAKLYFEQSGMDDIAIETTSGGTESKPTTWGVDGIFEMTISGTSLAANGLRQIGETACLIRPILIANPAFAAKRTLGKELIYGI